MSELTVDEKIRLSLLEERIEQGMKGFTEAGLALASIRDEQLYRIEHCTFEDYCRDRWNISRPRAYELIGAAEVVQCLSMSAIADKKLPANEAQARPLTRLPKEEIADVWEEAVETAPRQQPTMKHVKQVVDKRLGKPQPIEAGQTAIVTDLGHEDFGQQVKVTRVEREIIHAQKPSGESVVLLSGELQPLTLQQQVEQLRGLLREVVEDGVSDGLMVRIKAAIA